MSVVSPLTACLTGERFKAIKRDRITGFMDMFYCRIMSPLPVKACSARDLPGVAINDHL